MQSILALLAALWFGYQALAYEGPSPEVSGAVRTLCLGLTLMSLAMIRWGWPTRADGL